MANGMAGQVDQYQRPVAPEIANAKSTKCFFTGPERCILNWPTSLAEVLRQEVSEESRSHLLPRRALQEPLEGSALVDERSGAELAKAREMVAMKMRNKDGLDGGGLHTMAFVAGRLDKSHVLLGHGDQHAIKSARQRLRRVKKSAMIARIDQRFAVQGVCHVQKKGMIVSKSPTRLAGESRQLPAIAAIEHTDFEKGAARHERP